MSEWLTHMRDDQVERKSLLPSPRFFYPNSLEREEDKAKAIQAVKDSNAVVLTDPDADGLGAVLAVRQKHPEASFIPCGPHSRRLDVSDGLEIMKNHMDDDIYVYIADICPDDIDAISSLTDVAAMASETRWWDHHDWDDTLKDAVSRHVDELVVDEGETGKERCAAEIAVDQLSAEGVPIPDEVSEVVEVTGVYDCWRKKFDSDGVETHEFVDSRARDIHDYAYIADDETYLSNVEKYGADIREVDKIAEKLDKHREMDIEMMDVVTKRASYYDIGDWSVSIVYGRGPTNDIACELKQDGADCVAIVKPSGGVSFRGSDSFQYCSEIAKKFGGGGHKKASSCFIPPRNDGDETRRDTDLLDYSEHWLSQGQRIRRKVKSEIESLAEDK